MIDNIELFLLNPVKVRAIIQKYIDAYDKTDFQQISLSEQASIRNRLFAITKGFVDTTGNVYLPDELNPLALTDHITSKRAFTADKELITALICRSMVHSINMTYRMAAGRTQTELPFPINAHFTREEWKRIEQNYLKELAKRKDCKMIRKASKNI